MKGYSEYWQRAEAALDSIKSRQGTHTGHGIAIAYNGTRSTSGNVQIGGDADFQETIAGYIAKLNQSAEGRQVWSQAGVTSIVPSDGMTSWCDGSDLEVNTALFGYAVFCHEVRHAWQNATGVEGGGLARERDANAFGSRMAAEAGYLIDAAALAFMIVDPVTNIANAMYYGEYA